MRRAMKGEPEPIQAAAARPRRHRRRPSARVFGRFVKHKLYGACLQNRNCITFAALDVGHPWRRNAPERSCLHTLRQLAGPLT